MRCAKIEIGIVFNKRKKEVGRILRTLIPFLSRQGVKVKLLPEGKEFGYGKYIVSFGSFLKGTSLVIAIGGDGTLLTSAHIVGESEVPIMGINVGGLGFLAFFSPNEMKGVIKDFLSGKAKIEERVAIKSNFKGKGYLALNDIAVNIGPSLRAIDVIVYCQKRLVSRFVGDGVILSTPTGSTAYSLSCGGSIIYPNLSAFIITPIAPHALAARPIVLPADSEMTFQLAPGSERGFLVIDGQKRLSFAPGEEVVCRSAEKKIKIIVPKKKDYFTILRHKMRWGGERR